MIHGKKVIVVLPAFNAARTLETTIREIPMDVVDELLLVDDASGDDTAEVARELGIPTIVHAENRGYGANQKTCYREALRRGADVVVMLHPDYQYSPRLVPAMASMVATGQYDVVLGSRVLGRGALKGGMPLYKYASNRFLTLVENLLLDRKLSEYHTGYRAFSRAALEALPLERNSDDFVFDNQILVQSVWLDLEIGEIACPASYFPDASSINVQRSITYGLGVLSAATQYRLARLGVVKPALFEGLE